MKYNADDYLNYDPFEGDMDVDIRCRTVKLVRTRTPHDCAGGREPHIIQPGAMARFDKAFVDGSHWGSYYTCIACMDQWLDEFMGLDVDEYFDELGAAEPEPPYRCERTADMFGGMSSSTKAALACDRLTHQSQPNRSHQEERGVQYEEG